VHLLYSASRREAEAKSGAMAAYRLREVESPAQARSELVPDALSPPARLPPEGPGARP
jgi:hypothetical protein